MDDDPVARLGASLRRLRHRAGLTQDGLTMAAGYGASRSVISRAENATGRMFGPAEDASGRGKEARGELISADMVTLIDPVLGADGELIRLHREASAWLRRRRATARMPAMAMDSSTDTDAPSIGGASAGEDTTDRRQLGIGVAASAFAAGLAERMAMADPTPFALGEIKADVHRLPSLFGVLPDAELRAAVEPAWMGVERLLDTRVSRRVRDELGVCAGLYCYYLAWLAYEDLDDRSARAFLDIARRHAVETEDSLLSGSVAALHSCLARQSVDYVTAADVAQHARTDGRVHPYVRGLLAADEAVAAAMLGQVERSRRALKDLETHVWSGGVLPGPDPADDEYVHAVLASTLGYLGDGEAAESHACSSLELLEGCPKNYFAAGTYNSLARAFLRRRRPDPERAAAASARAIDVAPDRWVIESATRIARDLARWRDLPAVRDLGEQVVAARRALPAPPRTALA